MDRNYLLAGAAFAFVAVAVGAFGAHGLKDKLSAESLNRLEIGVRYEMYHALGLIAVAWLVQRSQGTAAAWSGRLFIAGIVLFSGSLYAMALTGWKTLGAVTPFGGLAFLAGWVLFLVSASRLTS